MTKAGMKKVEKIAKDHGFKNFKWINPKTVITGEWVRMKCMYGCHAYGKGGCCPPFGVPSVDECRRFFDDYRWGLFFHIALKVKSPEDRYPWGKDMTREGAALERDVFLANFRKAFIFPPSPCRLCANCKGTRKECLQPMIGRPSLEAFAVDVYGTAWKAGFPIQVVKDYSEEMNRYGLLLVE